MAPCHGKRDVWPAFCRKGGPINNSVWLQRIEPQQVYASKMRITVQGNRGVLGFQDRKQSSPKFYGNREAEGPGNQATSPHLISGLAWPLSSLLLSESLLSCPPWFYIVISQFPLTTECSKTSGSQFQFPGSEMWPSPLSGEKPASHRSLEATLSQHEVTWATQPRERTDYEVQGPGNMSCCPQVPGVRRAGLEISPKCSCVSTQRRV